MGKMFQLIEISNKNCNESWTNNDLINEDTLKCEYKGNYGIWVPGIDYMDESTNLSKDIEMLISTTGFPIETIKITTRKDWQAHYLTVTPEVRKQAIKLLKDRFNTAQKFIKQSHKNMNDLDILKKDFLNISLNLNVIRETLFPKYDFYFYLGKAGEDDVNTEVEFYKAILQSELNTVYRLVKSMTYYEV